MDTRKLTYREGHEPHNQALIYDEDTGVDVAVTYNDDGGATAAELVKRWNAYPELVEALRMITLAHNLAKKSTPANLRRTINEARTLLQSLNP